MKIPKKILERRRSVRVSESLPFTIGHDSYDLEAETVNVSAHGAMCVVGKDIPIMTQLKISLSLPGFCTDSNRSKKIHVKGVVVRKEKDPLSGGYTVAVFFSEIKPDDQRMLERFVASQSKKDADGHCA